jgi:hypothetical protein
MTDRTARYDNIDSTEAHERTEATLRKLPTEATDSADPTEATEAKDPTDPMDRTDPFELTLRIESVELIDHHERRSDTAVGSDTGSARPPYLVMTALPAASTTYHRPPALVNAWPVAVSGL